ncbi:SDR family oxidoreductase [Candidatus Phycosocius spiralis]|uniref:NAD(P)-dependent oxidoreductase n=1 Tax=Candidatus Phycosocius spiralis TaxID=2815099 RepID=A0ABQ4PWR0_9PROT|nr:SDR family oxidoreductase [Candidatus Phycosocius spiralis]GIU67113.1 NAD(P)-dependent oxidoreductase [Candidatus Phycosocius spiralis]
MDVLILGCGYVGTAFGLAMAQKGAIVKGSCRSTLRARALTAQGIEPILFDGTLNAALERAAQAATHVLASIPPGPNGDPAITALARTLEQYHPSWIAYLSTTGVYGDRQGGWACEDDTPTPLSIEAQRRAETETTWQSITPQAHIFRLPGIYGPGRSALEQVLAGTARRIDKPGQVFSRVHQCDIVSALMASCAQPNPGRIYNVCDDHPCTSGEVVVEACRLLGRTPPPLIPFEEAELSEMGRRFYSECKRVSNLRIKQELGWIPAFPTYVEGLADCLAHLDRNGH